MSILVLKHKLEGNVSEKLGKGEKLWQMRQLQEAAGKGYQQGPEGPEKGKGQKPEGKVLVILLMFGHSHTVFAMLPHCQVFIVWPLSSSTKNAVKVM